MKSKNQKTFEPEQTENFLEKTKKNHPDVYYSLNYVHRFLKALKKFRQKFFYTKQQIFSFSKKMKNCVVE